MGFLSIKEIATNYYYFITKIFNECRENSKTTNKVDIFYVLIIIFTGTIQNSKGRIIQRLEQKTLCYSYYSCYVMELCFYHRKYQGPIKGSRGKTSILYFRTLNLVRRNDTSDELDRLYKCK